MCRHANQNMTDRVSSSSSFALFCELLSKSSPCRIFAACWFVYEAKTVTAMIWSLDVEMTVLHLSFYRIVSRHTVWQSWFSRQQNSIRWWPTVTNIAVSQIFLYDAAIMLSFCCSCTLLGLILCILLMKLSCFMGGWLCPLTGNVDCSFQNYELWGTCSLSPSGIWFVAFVHVMAWL